MWNFYNPVRIHFGVGAFRDLHSVIAGRAYTVVSYGEPYFEDLVAQLSRHGSAPADTVAGIVPNPDFADLITACRQFATSPAPEVIVALGGGSVIDTAKVLAVAANGINAVRDFLESGGATDCLPRHAVPIIAVPTTAGTGSEVTKWATVWDRTSGKKYSLSRDDLYPTDAVIDPVLMKELPPALTVSTGLDALSHALESLWNVNRNPVSANFAVAAARSILEHLGPLAEDPEDLHGRIEMAQAATMAGLAFSNTRTALAHSLSYPISLHHGVPHGVACSFTLPDIMRSVIGVDARCDAALAQIFGEDLARGADRLAAFIRNLGISTRPGDHGIAAEDWTAWIAVALNGERGQNFIGSPSRVEAAFMQSAS